MAILSRRVEHMHQATAIAKRIPLRNPQISRNGIRCDEANAVHILGELIGILADNLNGGFPVLLEDLHRVGSGHPMPLEE